MRYFLRQENNGYILLFDATRGQLVYINDVDVKSVEPLYLCPPDTTIYAVGGEYPEIEIWPENELCEYENEYHHAYNRMPNKDGMRYMAKSAKQPNFEFV